MDHRCPVCRTDLRKRRWSQAIVARMEIECPHCKSVLRLNIHRAEVALVLAVFAAIVALGTLGYRLHSDALLLAAFIVAMLGSLALPVLERRYLRSWPRYAPLRAAPPPAQ